MKLRLLLLSCLLVSFVSVKVNAQNFQWTKKAGSQTYETTNNTITDDNGNVYITGEFQLSATFGNQTISSAGGADIFLAKYNKDGKLLWLKKAGGTSSDITYGLVMDSKGYIYLAGYIYSTAFFGSGIIAKDRQTFLAKYDSSGNIQWVHKLGDVYYGYSYNDNQSLIINNKDELYFAGTYSGNAVRFGNIKLPSTGGYDAFLAKIDTAANVSWAKRIKKTHITATTTKILEL